MATKKDLVEAYSFSRRRLVTAFVSGAPGGREVEPARPGRTIVGGVALAVLLAAGAAIAGVFSPTAPSDWKQKGLVISKETGSAYVIVDDSDDPVLRPVINATSAKLILGPDAAPRLVAQDTIDQQRIGDDIGIFGAPASVPTPGLLIDSGWTACTAAGSGIKVDVAQHPDVSTVPRTGVTVESGGEFFVVLPTADQRQAGADDPGAYVFPVPPQGATGNQTDNLLTAIGVQPTGDAVEVSREWVNLFPTGAPLTWASFGIATFGQTPSYAATDDTGVLQGSRVGDLLTVGGQQLLLSDTGPVQLTPFAAAVYRNVVRPDDKLVAPRAVDVAPRAPRDTETLADAHWPTTAPTRSPLDEPCAQLTARHGQAPVVHLVRPGDATAATDVPAGRKDPTVESGRGAYVLSGSWGANDQGSPFVIDSKGRANPLVGDGVAAQLGYGDYPATVVPDTWVKLFGCGVNLSQDAALSPPTESDAARCA